MHNATSANLLEDRMPRALSCGIGIKNFIQRGPDPSRHSIFVMKRTFSALTAALLLIAPTTLLAETSPAGAAPAKSEAPAGKAAPATADLAPAPGKIARWEDTGMNPAEAHEWKSYNFTPQEAVDWRRASFTPLVAKTWSEKNFDPDEAREWLDTAKNNRTLMAELDQSDPSQWKREGFSPRDRIAWWEAGFAFEDAVLLARSGMTPADAAWHGQEKLKELKGSVKAANAPGADTQPSGGGASGSSGGAGMSFTINFASIWSVVGNYLKVALIGLLSLFMVGVVYVFGRRYRIKLTPKRSSQAREPDTELPFADEEEPDPAKDKNSPEALKADPYIQQWNRRKPISKLAFTKAGGSYCIHCKSPHIRTSRMMPHKFAGITYTEYFCCKKCGRHFAIVNYMPIFYTMGGGLLAVTLLTAGFIYLLSMVPTPP